MTVNVMAGAGMLAAGIVGASLLGTIQDRSTAAGLAAYDRAHETRLADTHLSAPKQGVFGSYRALDAGIGRTSTGNRTAGDRDGRRRGKKGRCAKSRCCR